jgi:hypothetical protein
MANNSALLLLADGSAMVWKGKPRMPESIKSKRRLEPVKQVEAGILNIGYYEEGPMEAMVTELAL